jgi:hypothetical protein
MTNGKGRHWETLKTGIVLLASGFILNYLFERHNIFKVWENSQYPISLADCFYPPLCVLLALTGAVSIVLAVLRTTIQRSVLYSFAVAFPLTILYTLFAFSMQFIATGADRLGECDGVVQAASTSNVIPESKRSPGHPAVGCSVERRGMFLSYYNDIWVYGVTDLAAQQRVLDGIAERFRQAHTHPVQVTFRGEENWTVRQSKNGKATFGSGGPTKLIRIANIG